MGRLTTLGIALLWCATGLAAQTSQSDHTLRPGLELGYHEPVRALILRDEHAGLVTKPGTGQPLALEFEALGRRFELSLSPNAALLSASQRGRLAARDIHVYRGRIPAATGSWVRLVIHQGSPRGIIFDGNELYSLEVPGDSVLPTTNAPIIYGLTDLRIKPDALGCGIAGPNANGADAFRALAAELKTLAAAAGPGATLNLDLGAVADFEFSQSFGGGTEAALIDRFNRVDGIYSAELGVQISVAQIDIFTDDTDPFSGTDAGTLLNQLGNYRSATPAQRAQGLTHLFTGRNLDTSTVGIAFVGALCNSFAGAGLSEGRRGPLTDSLIAAHEIGHNFGADHDGDPNGQCPDTPETFLMAASINGSDQFSQCSKDQMALEVATASCITPISDVDVAALLDNPAVTVLTSTPFDYGITLDNQGSDDATDVSVAIQLPAELEIQGAQPSAGTCTTGAGAVDCDLGSIPGNSTRTIVLNLQAATPGDLDVSVSVSSATDINLANNQAAGTITADPAVDLALEPVAGPRISIDMAATLPVTLRNNTNLSASDVSVSFALDVGLRAEDASYELGTCSVADQQVDCSGGTLNAVGSTELTLRLTGVSVGQHGVQITVSSTEAELNGADNTVTATVTVDTVTSTVSGGGGGGGGALLWLLAWLLAAARARVGRQSATRSGRMRDALDTP